VARANSERFRIGLARCVDTATIVVAALGQQMGA